MRKKIETFLMVMLVMCAVLILMATPAYEPEAPAQQPTETSAPEPTQTVSAAANNSEPLSAPLQPSQGTMSRVEELLARDPLDQTAVSRYVYAADLNALEGTRGVDGAVRELARLAENREMNPISAFWLLVSGGLYEKEEDTSGVLPVDGFRVPEQKAAQYAYSDEGARQLLTDLLTLAVQMEDGLDLEPALLGANLTVEQGQVSFSEEEDCRYAYFVCTGERSTHILCFYLRGNGERITDVEFQLLNMRHADGDAKLLAQIDSNGDRQAAALMAAAELLMTGQTTAGQGQVPFSYEVGGYGATVERFHFTAETEQGSLTNYRLRTNG